MAFCCDANKDVKQHDYNFEGPSNQSNGQADWGADRPELDNCVKADHYNSDYNLDGNCCDAVELPCIAKTFGDPEYRLFALSHEALGPSCP